MWYHVSEPNSYLVITGAGIETIKIKKKAMVMPFQKVTKISITPFDFSMSLQAMTSEKLKFALPAVFTIGPDDKIEALTKYAILLTGNSDGQVVADKGTVSTGRGHVQEIVKGIIEGETRSLVSTMTMEELFNNRSVFKTKVIHSVQTELDQFGLRIYNANVKELQDLPDSHYFEFLARKAHEGAENQAKVDVANARMNGAIGEAEKQGKTKQEIAKINANTAVLETERKKEKAVADAKLKSQEIEIERNLNIERIQAERAAEERDAELQKTVEQKKADMELERLRATEVTRAKIAKESAQQQADAALYTQTKAADGKKYAQTADAEAVYFRTAKDADAALYRKARDAEASLAAKQKEAEALYVLEEKRAEAMFIMKQKAADADYIARKKEADGLQELAKGYSALGQALGGPEQVMQYMMLQNGTYQQLAEANARAIHGMQPKINIWNTGALGEASDTMAPIRNLFQALPPLLGTIQDQTGIKPPAWFAQMPDEQAKTPDALTRHGEKQKSLTNGVNGSNGANGAPPAWFAQLPEEQAGVPAIPPRKGSRDKTLLNGVNGSQNDKRMVV